MVKRVQIREPSPTAIAVRLPVVIVVVVVVLIIIVLLFIIIIIVIRIMPRLATAPEVGLSVYSGIPKMLRWIA